MELFDYDFFATEYSLTMQATNSSLNNRRNIAKIERVLNIFLDPNFKLRNSVALNAFLDYLAKETIDSSNEHSGGEPDNRPIFKEYSDVFCQWLITAVKIWEEQDNNLPNTILAFSLNLASIMSRDEQLFVQLNSQNVYESIVAFAQNNLISDAMVTQGLISLLLSFLEHKSGLQWLLATTHWNDVISLGINMQDDSIRIKCSQFVAKFLQKAIYINRSFCCNLVTILLKPLKDALKTYSKTTAAIDPFHSNKVFDFLKPTLIFILGVTEFIAKSTNNYSLDVFIELKGLDMVSKLIFFSQNGDFTILLLKVSSVLSLYKVVLVAKAPNKNEKLVQGGLHHVWKLVIDMFSVEINKGNDTCVIQICQYVHTLYSRIPNKLPCLRRREGELLEFQNQIMMLQLMPILIFLTDKSGIDIEDTLNDVYQRDFFQKVLKISSTNVFLLAISLGRFPLKDFFLKLVRLLVPEIRYLVTLNESPGTWIVYGHPLDSNFSQANEQEKWKDRLLARPDVIEYLTSSLVYIMMTKNALNKFQAAIYFQPLVFCLKKNLDNLSEQGQIYTIPSYTLFIKTLIEAIIELMQAFDLTWRDSIATISVMSIAYDFLQFPHWSDKLIISGLMLLNLAISKHMSPDMVLLVDKSKDTLVSLTGIMLAAKCRSSNFDIRNAALENVHTLSLNANSKFPSYTNIILEADLHWLVVEMALNDQENCVRATAFRCLQELIQIEEVWEMFNNMETFLDCILGVLEFESEGMIVKEAAKLMTNMSKYQRFPTNVLPRIYDIMTHAATADSNWEVRCNALDFWFYVWESHLNNEGMVDRRFPEVTFSKEKRKIVTLNKMEVRRRVIKVLNEMSRIGCLHVMVYAYRDETNEEIGQRAAYVAEIVREKFLYYKITSENVDTHEQLSSFISSKYELISDISMPMSTSDCDDVDSSLKSGQPISSFSCVLSEDIKPLPQCSTNLLDSLESSNQYLPSVKESTSINTLPQSSTIKQTRKKSNSNNLYLTDRNEDVDGCGDFLCDIVTNQAAKPNNFMEQMEVEQIMEVLLDSEHITSSEQKPCSTYQVPKTKTEKVKATYLAPSEYLNIIYNYEPAYRLKTSEPLDSLQKLNSLLNDILKDNDMVSDTINMAYKI